MMDLALEEAALAADAGEVPVGAVITGPDGTVLARAHNRVVRDRDPTAHAELLAIREAAKTLQSERLIGCTLWVTLEPCAMCAQAIAFARLDKLYFGADDPKGGGTLHGARIFDQKTTHHKPDVYGGIRADRAAKMLQAFFQARRSG